MQMLFEERAGCSMRRYLSTRRSVAIQEAEADIYYFRLRSGNRIETEHGTSF